MQYGLANKPLTSFLGSAQRGVQPICLQTWRQHFRQPHTCVCLSSFSTVQQRPDASGVPEADTTLSRDALDKVFAAEPVRSPNTLRKLCVLGIDPDISGAIAVMQWNVSPTVAKLELQDATIQIYDMPVTKVAIGKKLRRQADPIGIAQLMTSLNLCPSTEIRAVLEHPMPNAINGKWSWFSAGYNSGIWKGVLYSQGIPFESVAARVWKTDMQLIKTGKEGSRELAQTILPQATQQLKRKKDHGRAEALLLATWGIGFRRTTDDIAAANAAAFAALEDCDEDSTEGFSKAGHEQ